MGSEMCIRDRYTIGILQLPSSREVTSILRPLLVTEGSIKDRYEQLKQMEERFRIYGRDFPVCPMDIESENAFERLIRSLAENKIIKMVNSIIKTERTNIENRILAILREYEGPLEKDEIDNLFVISTSDGHKFTTEIYLKMLEERKDVEYVKGLGYRIRDKTLIEQEFFELKKKLEMYKRRYEQYLYGYIISVKQRDKNEIIIKDCINELAGLAESLEKIRFIPAYEQNKTRQFILFSLLMEQLEKILGLVEKDTASDFDLFIEAFFNQVEKFLSGRTDRGNIENKQVAYIDSLYYYGLEREANRQVLYIHNRHHSLKTDILLLRKCEELSLNMAFFKILEDFKMALQKSGFSFSHDGWLRLNYPILFERRLSWLAEDIDPYLALAVIRRESRFEPKVVSKSGALGLMQLMPATASQMAKVKKIDPEMLFDPGYNIKLGCRYIRWLDVRLRRDEVVIAAYNAGPTAARRWKRQAGTDIETFIEAIDYEQSRNYTRGVIGDYLWYKYLWPNQFDDNDKATSK